MIDAVTLRHGLLQALSSYYERMDDAQPFGWSRERFGWAVVLNARGEPVDAQDLRDLSGKKPIATLRLVPAASKRTVAISPNFLWDKTSYSLGRTGGEGKRTAPEHAAFVRTHLERLADTADEGLVALRLFLEGWNPDRFDRPPFVPEMLDANVMFRLDGDMAFLHQRPAARLLVETIAAANSRDTAFCLASGERGPVARLHQSIKGVEGAQSSGASLVSFNLEAFESYGKSQGENAPTSEAVAFRYGAALNRMLERESRNRVSRPIGDATVVFWADASNAKTGAAADEWFGRALSMDVEDTAEARKIGEQLQAVATGRPIAELQPGIEAGTRFHILGLSPNASRLSIRFWLSDTLEVFARRLAQHHQDLTIEPSPWSRPPTLNYLLAQTTALQCKFANIPSQLAGEVMRAILAGTRYPHSWLAAAIMRLRAGDDPGSGWHAAAVRAVLVRRQRSKNGWNLTKEENPLMSLDRDHRHIAYQLGRLFAVYELAQRAALGRDVKSTIRDKYFGAACATPAIVFPLIIRNGQNHLARVRKDKTGWAVLIERELEEVMARVTPTMPFSLPRSLRLEDQGEFAIGYYHQRKAKLGDDTADQPTFDEHNEEGNDNDE